MTRKNVYLFYLLMFFFIQIGFSQVKKEYNTPLSFEENIGQKNSKVKFSTNGQGFSFFLTKNSMVFDFVEILQEDQDDSLKKNALDHFKKNPT